VDPSRVDVVLVRPARAANVAAACRAMKNMGVRSLTLVGEVAGIDDAAARALAYRAWDVLDGARRVGSLEEAVAGATLVAGTSAAPDPRASTARSLAADASEGARGGRLALVFGPEASGLTSRELALCHVRVRVPTDPAHPSLNLAQAVLVLLYELRTAWLGAGATGPEPPSRATAGELEEAMGALREGLLAIGYLNPDNPEAILAELRALLARARPTPREATLLRGLARQVRWAGERIARGEGGDDNRGPFGGGP
jgi:TrmH family RNA methyltransferase